MRQRHQFRIPAKRIANLAHLHVSHRTGITREKPDVNLRPRFFRRDRNGGLGSGILRRLVLGTARPCTL